MLYALLLAVSGEDVPIWHFSRWLLHASEGRKSTSNVNGSIVLCYFDGWDSLPLYYHIRRI